MSAPQQDDWKTRYAWLAALLAWFALILQLCLSIGLAQSNGRGVLNGLWMYFAFFTILTNLLAAAALTLPLIAPRSKAGEFFARTGTITGIAANIVLVGVTYSLLLRNVWQPQGWQLVADILLHDIDPILFVVYWWLAGTRRDLRYSDIVYWAGYPFAYFAYAVLRGLTSGFYAYHFIDIAALGFARVMLNALAILAAFVVVAAILIAIGRLKTPVARRA